MKPDFLITLRERFRQCRFPRSKKRRIRRKWRKNVKNWGKDLRVFENVFIGGPLSGLPPQEEMPRHLEMHPDVWEVIRSNNPDLAARCDVRHYAEYQFLTSQSHSPGPGASPA